MWPGEWAAAEGWNPGLHDANAFLATDPAGFLVGELDGQPIGCISAVSYGGAFGFIGFYLLQPAFRGQGYGIQLWRKALEKLAGLPVGPDGVFAQQANYARVGFNFAYSNLRFEFSGGNTAGTVRRKRRPTRLGAANRLAGLRPRLFPRAAPGVFAGLAPPARKPRIGRG